MTSMHVEMHSTKNEQLAPRSRMIVSNKPKHQDKVHFPVLSVLRTPMGEPKLFRNCKTESGRFGAVRAELGWFGQLWTVQRGFGRCCTVLGNLGRKGEICKKGGPGNFEYTFWHFERRFKMPNLYSKLMLNTS